MRTHSSQPSVVVMFERIMVGFAGDRAGYDAITLAALLAAAVNSELIVVYPYYPLLASEFCEQVEERIREGVQEATAGIEGMPAPVYRSSEVAWPIHALHEQARKEGADLIVFGAAREGLAVHLHHSTMERLIHGAPCAVGVAPAGYAESDPRRLRHIGVGFCESEENRGAVNIAHELAGVLAGGELEMIAGSGLSPTLASYAVSSGSLPAVESELYDDVERKLERAAGRLQGGVPIHLQAIKGEPCRMLIERSSDLDILMLGSRGYGPVRHALLGGVSAQVMREAHCPVLVVPRGAVVNAASGIQVRAGVIR
jgi:nucleotide-binding universal stress UspA family protein